MLHRQKITIFAFSLASSENVSNCKPDYCQSDYCKPDYWACFASPDKTQPQTACLMQRNQLFEKSACEDKKYWIFNDVNNISNPSLIAPSKKQISVFIDDIIKWNRISYQKPINLFFSCYAGISRSSAAMLIALKIIFPQYSIENLAIFLRSKNPYVTPNILMCQISDEILNTGGKITAAAKNIARGKDIESGTDIASGKDIASGTGAKIPKITKISNLDVARTLRLQEP